jgi:hypothetical protein
MFRFLLQSFIVLLLTLLTQVGGLLWLICYGLGGLWKGRRIGGALLLFVPLYLLLLIVVLPMASGYFGRTPLPVFSSPSLKPISLVYPLLNRHYVTFETNRTLQEVAHQLRLEHPDAELQYLDAGFPLFKKYPLLPHLSHNDGRKVDLAFFYTQPDGAPTNDKPSRSGYGVFEGPREGEQPTADACDQKGYWQYSYPQYLTMGSRPDLSFDAGRTKKVLQLLLEQPGIGKVFLEPHLKERLGLAKAQKISFHGCGTVRHDDHIHIQMQ